VEESDYSDRVLAAMMRECPSLNSFNLFIVPLMKSLPKPLQGVAASEAKRRGYAPNKEKGIYE
jgi:hypothetical protein